MAPSHLIFSHLIQIFYDFPRASNYLLLQRKPMVELFPSVPLQKATEVLANAPTTPAEAVTIFDEITNLESEAAVKELSGKESDAVVKELSGKAKAKMDAVDGELSKLVGLDAVKLQFHEWFKGMFLDESRRALGLKVSRRRPPHMVFVGNPGTGKFSLARILGKLFHKSGILRKKKVVEVYMNQTAKKTREKIQEAHGGILFVHKSYNSAMTTSTFYDLLKNEALEEIMMAMDSGKVVVIFSGNDEAMEHAITSHEGLRGKLTNIFHFDDFTCIDLAKIFHAKLSNADQSSPLNGFKLHTSCSVEAVAAIMERGTTEKQRKEMNGGLVDQMLIKAKENLDSRVGFECKDTDSLLTITSEDLAAALSSLKSKGKRKRSEDTCNNNVKAKTDAPEPVKAKTVAPEPVKEKETEKKMDAKAKMDALESELSKLMGMDALKLQLEKWLKGMIVDERCQTVGLDVGSRRLPQMVFLGNPGTGKTMVARVLAKLLHMVGIIPKDKVIEVQRTDLVAEYIGQTGPKTRKKGGILFVDEAYRLVVESSSKDFGLEALEEIMSSMDNGDTVIIFAGNSKPMKRIISSNEGFKRRVSKVFNFDDYSCQDLAKIVHLKMSNQDKNNPYFGFKLHPECNLEAIAKLIERETTEEQRKELNGGLVDQMLGNARENFDSRIDVESIDAHLERTITLEDLAVGIKDKGKEWLNGATKPTHFFSLYI